MSVAQRVFLGGIAGLSVLLITQKFDLAFTAMTIVAMCC